MLFANQIIKKRMITMNIKAKPQVTAVFPASSDVAKAHFQAKLTFEADCWDVHYDMSHNIADFILVDVRSPKLYQKSHAVGAINIPHATMTAKRMAEFPPETLFIVYCTGPGCNGADKAALRLSSLGRPVKIMIGGITNWEDIERFPVERG
jgi:rhodanese-related sulfurtransferase